MGKVGANFPRAFDGAAVLNIISVVLLCIFAIASGIAAPTNKKPASERSQGHIQSVTEEATAVCTLAEGFDNIGSSGWFMQNNTVPPGTTGWSQGDPTMFTSQSGASNS